VKSESLAGSKWSEVTFRASFAARVAGFPVEALSSTTGTERHVQSDIEKWSGKLKGTRVMPLSEAVCKRCWTEGGRQPEAWGEQQEREWRSGEVLCMIRTEQSMEAEPGQRPMPEECWLPTDCLPPAWCPYAAEHAVSQEPDGCR